MKRPTKYDVPLNTRISTSMDKAIKQIVKTGKCGDDKSDVVRAAIIKFLAAKGKKVAE